MYRSHGSDPRASIRGLKDSNGNRPHFIFYSPTGPPGPLSATRLLHKPTNPTSTVSALTRFFRMEKSPSGPEFQREDTPEPEEGVFGKGKGEEAMSGQAAGSGGSGGHMTGLDGGREESYVSECIICWQPVHSTSQEQGDARTIHICSYADCRAMTCAPCAAAWVEHQIQTQPLAYCPVCIRQFSTEDLLRLRQYSNPTWYNKSPSLVQQSEGPANPPKHQSFRDAIAEYRASSEGRDLGPQDARRFIEWRNKNKKRTSGAVEKGMIEKFWEWSFSPGGEHGKPGSRGASSTPANLPEMVQAGPPRWWEGLYDRQGPAAQCVEALVKNPQAKHILERLGECVGAGADDGERQMIQERIKWVAFAYAQRQHDRQAGKPHRYPPSKPRRQPIDIPRTASHHDLLWILSTIEPDDEALPFDTPIPSMAQMPGRPDSEARPPKAARPSPVPAAPQGALVEPLGRSEILVLGQPGGFQFSMDLLPGQTVAQAMTAYLHSLDRAAASPAVRAGEPLWVQPSGASQDLGPVMQPVAHFEAHQGPLPAEIAHLRLPDDVVRPVYSSFWAHRAPSIPPPQPLYNMQSAGTSSSSSALVSLPSGSIGSSLKTTIAIPAIPNLPKYAPLADFRHSGIPEPPMPPELKNAILRVIKRHKEEEDGTEDEDIRDDMPVKKVPKLMKSLESLCAGLKMKSKPKAKAKDKGGKAKDKAKAKAMA